MCWEIPLLMVSRSVRASIIALTLHGTKRPQAVTEPVVHRHHQEIRVHTLQDIAVDLLLDIKAVHLLDIKAVHPLDIKAVHPLDTAADLLLDITTILLPQGINCFLERNILFC